MKSGFRIAEELGYEELDVNIRLTQLNQLSKEQMTSIFEDKTNFNILYFYHNEFKNIDFNNYDIVILSAGNAFHKSLFKYFSENNEKREKTKIISIFPGVIFGDYDSLCSRINSDVLLVNNRQDYKSALDLKEKVKSNIEILHYGLVLAKKYKTNLDSNLVYYIDQVKIPENYKDRLYIVKKLINLANLYKRKKFFIKSRVKLNERTVHKNHFPLEMIIKKEFKRENIPSNLNFTYEPIELCIEKASLILTISSTVALEAIYNNIPVAIISDFGTDKSFANKNFLTSGCFITFDDIMTKELGIDKKWYHEMVDFPENRQILLNELIKIKFKKTKYYFEINEKNNENKCQFNIIRILKRFISKLGLVLNFMFILYKFKKL